MAVARYKATVEVNTVQVDHLLNAVMRAVSPVGLEPFAEDVADYLSERVVERFAYEGDAASGNWPALSEATQGIRAKMGYGPDGPINIRTETLFEWAAYSADIESIPGGVMVEIPDTKRMDATTLQKLKVAQMGTNDNAMIPGAVTPPRPVVALDERDMVDIMAKLQIYIMAATVNQFVALGTP